jgi:hypothetical protein
MIQTVDVVLSDIFMRIGRNTTTQDHLKEDTVRLKLVQPLLKSNSPMSNITVLCCGKNWLSQVSCGLLLI